MTQEPPMQGPIARRPTTISVTTPASPPKRGPRRRTTNVTNRASSVRKQTLLAPVDSRKMPQKVPNPSHRHGTPSGPWPFLDLHTKIEPEEIINPRLQLTPCDGHEKLQGDEHCWCKYPQSLYPNWTPVQQDASQITQGKLNKAPWSIYRLVVQDTGHFVAKPPQPGNSADAQTFWTAFREDRHPDYHVQALFIDNMAGPIMQMLGTKFNIEPFFFSSSFGWIPSRYQENIVADESDHITITLTFIRCMRNPQVMDKPADNKGQHPPTEHSARVHDKPNNDLEIDTRAPLPLRSSDFILSSDILSLHMIRHPDGNTIISYHPPGGYRATSAEDLRDRFQLTGRSVYWCHIFEKSKDPTFAFLSLLWYPLYAWDESLEALYAHICVLESEVLDDNDMEFTQELHRIQANLLHYASLLEDFRKTVQFVLDTPYPALFNTKYFKNEEKIESMQAMKKECTTLLDEIHRLEKGRAMQERRLKNIMDLAFSIVHIQDSTEMRKLTEATVRDSAAMKQIAYLTMVFLPASFVATAFGMNVGEINDSVPTLGQYFATAIPLTAVTIWIVVALQIQIKHPRSKSRTAALRSRQLDYTNKCFASTNEHVLATSADHHMQTPDGYPYHHDDIFYDDIEAAYHSGDEHTQQLSIWRRLLWPVSLCQVAIESWREEQQWNRWLTSRDTEPAAISPYVPPDEDKTGMVNKRLVKSPTEVTFEVRAVEQTRQGIEEVITTVSPANGHTTAT